MAGEVAFRKNQFGIESPQGTPVAATKRFPGTIKLPKDRVVKFIRDTNGKLLRANRTAIHQIQVDGMILTLDDPVFQDLPWLLSIGLVGGVTPVEQTTDQNDFLWDFTHSLTAANEPESATVECGNDTQAYEIEYVMAKKYTISGNIGSDEPVKIEVETFGKQITPTTFTAGLSLVAGEAMSANMTKFYMDSTWATLGTTQKTDLLKKYTITILTGLTPKNDANGQKTMTGYNESVLDAMVALTLEGNSVADGIWDDYRAETARALRIEILGSQIGTGDPHSLVVDMYGKFEEVLPMDGDENGSDLHTAIFTCLGDGQSTEHNFAVKVTTDIDTAG